MHLHAIRMLELPNNEHLRHFGTRLVYPWLFVVWRRRPFTFLGAGGEGKGSGNSSQGQIQDFKEGGSWPWPHPHPLPHSFWAGLHSDGGGAAF
jgi:hypothetical protein